MTIVVGAVLISSVSLVSSANTRLSQRTRDLSLMNAYTTSKVESLRSAGYLNLANGITTITSELPSELKGANGTLTISDHPTVAGLKQAGISITYNDQGTNRTYSYTSYVGELGVGQY